MYITKKKFSLPEILIAVAVFGLLFSVTAYIFKSGRWIFHTKNFQASVQQSGRFLLDHLTMDIRSCSEFTECSSNTLKLKCFEKDSADPSLESAPKTVDVEYTLDSAKGIVTRKYGSTTYKFAFVDNIAFLGYKIVISMGGDGQRNLKYEKTTDASKTVATAIRISMKRDEKMPGHEDEDQAVELITFLVSASRSRLLMFGMNSEYENQRYGYFSSLEDNKF